MEAEQSKIISVCFREQEKKVGKVVSANFCFLKSK